MIASCRGLLFGLLLVAPGLVAQKPYKPKVPIRGASREGHNALKKFHVAEGLQASLWAAEPHLANPVAFSVDERGRIYVAETFRLHYGVTDNRRYAKDWLDDDLACRTVEDRIAMYRRHLGAKIAGWKTEEERIRLLEDVNGDGHCDRSEVFAEGFRDLPDGIAAGLLARRNAVWFTCIPKVWKLTDTDGDGRADRRRVLYDGFGVHTSLLGHDLHGLRMGPDGLLYFSIGDRGFNVPTKAGRLAFPDEGAVLRCRPDGSELEVVHRGLRNPQELAFDSFGNLFTGDNNSDGDDRARWVYIVEGGNSGWQIGYQTIPDRGPWSNERLWYPHFAGQAAYIVPPVANFTNGPSGLTYDPGVGLPEKYRGCFLLCDFRGASAVSGIWALRSRPKGAGFELASTEKFIWGVLATDVDFGPDGSVFLTDWTEGWEQSGKGRIYRIVAKGLANDALAKSTRQLIETGMAGRPIEELLRLLAHADQRVRQAAQFALVAKGAVAPLGAAAGGPGPRLARIHAIWGLGQLARKHPEILEPSAKLLSDFDEEVRAQFAKVCGWAKAAKLAPKLEQALADRSSRVRFFAAISRGQIGSAGKATTAKLVRMLRENADTDPYLRHAGVMGLAGCARRAELLHFAGDPSCAVRMGVLLAMRRRRMTEVARFLDDPNHLLVVEAARAIHDAPIPGAREPLAALLNRPGITDRATLRRALNANVRLGTKRAVERLFWFAANRTAPSERRIEALRALAEWKTPPRRDRVLNRWSPIEHAALGDAVTQDAADTLPELLSAAPEAVRRAACRTASALGVRSALPALTHLVRDGAVAAETRAAALDACARLGAPDFRKLVELAVKAPAAPLRKDGLRHLAKLDPARATPLLDAVARNGKASTGERQSALGVLSSLQTDAAREALGRFVTDLEAGKVAPALRLDVLEAATATEDQALQKRAAAIVRARNAKPTLTERYDDVLQGGRRSGGNRLFWETPKTGCQRCHTANGHGGRAGPDLKALGKRLTREQILEAILDPNAKIVAGFGTYVLEMKSGAVHSGVLVPVDDARVEIKPAEGPSVVVKKADIAFKSKPTSSMPPVSHLLSRRELRDLIEYLASLKK